MSDRHAPHPEAARDGCLIRAAGIAIVVAILAWLVTLLVHAGG